MLKGPIYFLLELDMFMFFLVYSYSTSAKILQCCLDNIDIAKLFVSCTFKNILFTALDSLLLFLH